MTEPDEADKFAEEMMWRYYHASDVVIPPTAPLRIDGRRLTGIEAHNVTEAFAYAYRVGKAASAERIKSLEAAIRRLLTASEPVETYTHEICVRLEEAVEHADALLKEADQ
jgi:hypothetical protein